ncbi:MAG: DUF4330 domain-containing protein [Defluviitaleaceae bacterium]|nr:DUF4330 domain-containing protein [Defluviitaleaceae bacterium]
MENKKTKFNFIDVLIIIFVIAAIAFGAWFFFVRSGDSEIREVRFTVEIRETPLGMHQNFPLGASVLESVFNFHLGYIENVDHKPSTEPTFNHDTQTLHMTEIPNHYDILVTIISSANVNESRIMVEETALRVGNLIHLRGQGFAGYGFIIEIEILGE